MHHLHRIFFVKVMHKHAVQEYQEETIIKKGKTGLRRLFEMFLSFPIIAEAPIPLPEILDEPSLEEPSI